MCGMLGLSLPLSGVACGDAEIQTSNTGNIIIIGAGAAGLTAGYLEVG